MEILVTGCAGFIGYHLSGKLLSNGFRVIGIDNLNSYYDVNLKKARLKQLKECEHFIYYQLDIENQHDIIRFLDQTKTTHVVHLAAQAGVRYSIENPKAYIDSNILGFLNILEFCRKKEIAHLIYASSSSVYGLNTKMPFSTHDRVDHPISLYAATKKSNELMAHSYSYLYGLPTTGLRFFTVYGPWGRPDMALFLFAQKIMKGEAIQVFNQGKMKRDFTYVDDITEGVVRLLNNAPNRNPSRDFKPSDSVAPYKIYNIGNNQPVKLLYFIELLEESIGKKAIKQMLPMQLGDVAETFADIDELITDTGFRPNTPIENGINQFVDWFKWYYYS